MTTKERTMFTPETANARLPLVRVIVEDAMAKWKELTRLREVLEGDDDPLRAKSAGALDPRARRAASEDATRIEDELRGCLREIDELGAEVKSLEVGLIDFPMKLGARVVELCWRAGEGKIEHWHEIGAGFPGRRPVTELPR